MKIQKKSCAVLTCTSLTLIWCQHGVWLLKYALSSLITALPSQLPTLSFLLVIQLLLKYSPEEKNTLNVILLFLLRCIYVTHLPLPRYFKTSSEIWRWNVIKAISAVVGSKLGKLHPRWPTALSWLIMNSLRTLCTSICTVSVGKNTWPTFMHWTDSTP